MRHLGRREFLIAAGALLAAPSMDRAQQFTKVYRLGYITPVPSYDTFNANLLPALRERGYIEGRNLEVLRRHGDLRQDKLPAAANEIMRWKPDVIVSVNNPTTRAAQKATDTIPIVMVLGRDVVKERIVTSLAKPGGNVTGLTQDVGVATYDKLFDFLRDAVPQLSRVAVLWDSGAGCPASCKLSLEEGVARIGAQLIFLDFQDDLDSLFGAAARQGAQALVTGGGAPMFHRRKEIVELAAKHRLIDVHPASPFADAGGLMAYAVDWPSQFRRAAYYVARLFKGAKPADLPIEQPTKFEFVVNLKSAKARGIAIPQAVLLRADRVIE